MILTSIRQTFYNLKRDSFKFTARPDIFHRTAGESAPRAPFRAMRRDHIFLFHGKKKMVWQKD